MSGVKLNSNTIDGIESTVPYSYSRASLLFQDCDERANIHRTAALCTLACTDKLLTFHRKSQGS